MAWLRELLKQEMLLMLFLLFQRDSPKREIEKQQVTWNRTMDIHIQIHTHTQACSQTQKLWMEWRNNLIHWLTSGLTAGWLAGYSFTENSQQLKRENGKKCLKIKCEEGKLRVYISHSKGEREVNRLWWKRWWLWWPSKRKKIHHRQLLVEGKMRGIFFS